MQELNQFEDKRKQAAGAMRECVPCAGFCCSWAIVPLWAASRAWKKAMQAWACAIGLGSWLGLAVARLTDLDPSWAYGFKLSLALGQK